MQLHLLLAGRTSKRRSPWKRVHRSVLLAYCATKRWGIRTWIAGEKIIEAAVLLDDHDHVLDVGAGARWNAGSGEYSRTFRAAGRRGATRAAANRKGESGATQQPHPD